jgi:hypothetical protein
VQSDWDLDSALLSTDNECLPESYNLYLIASERDTFPPQVNKLNGLEHQSPTSATHRDHQTRHGCLVASLERGEDSYEIFKASQSQ